MKKIIICLLVFAVGLYGSVLQAQILSAGAGTDFSIGAGTTVSADSLELTPSALYSFSNNTISKSNTVSNSTSINYISKVYQFNATTASYSGALKIYYNNSQLNGLTASGLKLLIHNGTSWSLDNNSSSNTSSNVVVNTSVSGVALREISAGVCSPNTGDTTASAFDSFVWYGVTYTASATPTHTLTNVAGCDSVVTLHLTINTQNFFTRCNATWSKQNLDVTTYNDGTPIPQVTDFSTLYTMQTGAWMYYNNIPGPNKLYNWYAVAGIYDAQSLSNPTLRKQIAPTGWRVPNDSEWNKLTKCFDANADTSCLNCNASSTAGDSLKNIGLINAYLGSCDYGGCGNLNIWQNYWTSSSYDGAYALARYVNNYEPNLQRYIQYAEKYHGFSVPLIQDLTSTGDTTATACGSFVWYGQTYSTSGTPTHIFTNANGYDSVVTLHLTINALPTPTFTSSPSTTCLNSDVTYTTQSGQASYSWMVAGTAGVDYSITSGGLGSSSNTVTLKWLTAGSKNVSVNYTDQNGCTGGGIDIPTNGLVGYWPFTGNANDATAGGHNGDLRGTTLPALITDRHGNTNSAYAFTAGGTIPNHIYVGRNVLSNYSQMAVSLWFKTGSTTLSLPLSSGNNNEYNIQINPNGKIATGTFHCNNGTVTNGGYVYTESSNAYNDNSWHHAVLVYDGSYNKLYVDGVFNSQVQNISGTTTPGCASNANYSDLSFSSYYLYGDYYPLSSTEDLDDIAIYNRALSANEVADLYNAQNSEIIGGATSTTTVSIANTGDTTASACGSFVWYGVTYTSSATPTRTFTNVSGCDSVVTLHLTIRNTNTGDTTATACGSFVWYGQMYTASGTPTHTFTNVNGCDSVVTLHLTIIIQSVSPLNADVLVVSGGGSGGAGYGGGGGGGAVKYFTSQTVSGATTVIVGAGGAAVNITTNGTTVSGNPGESSSFGILVATSSATANGPNSAGGGGGGAGSGGGAGGNFNTASISGGTAVSGMGNNGGNSAGNGRNFSNVCGGGGGGAGAVGGLGGTNTSPANRGGAGGAGISNSISGVAVFYGGGGGGGVTFNGNAGGAGGNGGGGAGSKGDVAATNGTANTGGGGGGFGASNGGASNNYSGAGGSGVVIVRYPGSTILATGGTVTQAGGYTIHTFNSSGTFTVLNPNSSDTTASACGSFVWYGVTYTSSATPTRTFTNVSGCDSVVTLHLTINSATSSTETVSACGSYVWKGTTYTTSGTKTFTTTNAAACDSVVTLNLTINTTTTSSSTITNCDNYTWNGTTYTTSGTYTFTTTNTVGCDSVATLILTILEQLTAPTDVVITPINGGGTLQFTAPTATNNNITNYEYSVDNGNTWVAFSSRVLRSLINLINLAFLNDFVYQLEF